VIRLLSRACRSYISILATEVLRNTLTKICLGV
jgi:hypothetical protein